MAFRNPVTSLPASAIVGKIDPATQVAAGTLGVGVVLPTGQLSGQIDPAAQVAAGTLGAGVQLPAGQIAGKVSPASQIAAGALAAGVLLATGQLSGTLNPATQIGAGTLGAGVVLPSSQVGAGNLPSGVLLPTTQLSGTIIAGQIAANAIGANAIAANAIGAAAIAAGAIDGKTITGALIRTAASGGRFEQNTAGAKLYAPDGTTVLVDLNPAGLVAAGSFRADDPNITGYGYLKDGTLGFTEADGTEGFGGRLTRTAGTEVTLYGRTPKNTAGGRFPPGRITLTGTDGTAATYASQIDVQATSVNVIDTASGKHGALSVQVPATFTSGVQAPALTPAGGANGSSTSTTSATGVVVTGSSVSFTAPPSGRVLVLLSMFLRTGTAGTYAEGDFVVKDDTGAVVRAAAATATTVLALNANTQWIKSGGGSVVSGLTSGVVHTVSGWISTQTAGISVDGSIALFTIVPLL